MANPFLVLGGIAVGIITAAFGVLAVPGWVASAQDASAINDLGGIRAVQAAAVSGTGAYVGAIDKLTDGTSGTALALAGGTELIGISADGGKAWCAAARSESGGYFASSNARISKAPQADPARAMADARCQGSTARQVLDGAYGAPVEARRNLATYSTGDAYKPTLLPEFGIEATRWPALGTYTTVDGWARFTVSGDSRGYGFHLAHNPESLTPAISQMPVVAAGEGYSIGIDLRSSAPTNGTICWRFANASAGWATVYVCNDPVPITGSITKVHASFTVPAGSTHVAALVKAGVPTGEHIEVRHLIVERSASAGEYFDGDTQPIGANSFTEWAGEPGQSQSVTYKRNGAR